MTTTVELLLAKLHPANRVRPSGHTGPGGIHLSEAAGCPRKQTLRILGYASEAATESQQASTRTLLTVIRQQAWCGSRRPLTRQISSN